MLKEKPKAPIKVAAIVKGTFDYQGPFDDDEWMLSFQLATPINKSTHVFKNREISDTAEMWKDSQRLNQCAVGRNEYLLALNDAMYVTEILDPKTVDLTAVLTQQTGKAKR
jgi:hypothetical protein